MITLEKGSFRVSGTSRASQLREIAVREARLREPVFELLGRLEALFPIAQLEVWRKTGQAPEEAILEQWGRELDRSREPLSLALVGPTLTKDAFDDFATPLGPLTTKTLADNEIGELIRGTLGQRAGARRALRELFAAGPTPAILQSIQSAVGLTPRMQEAVYRRRDKLLAAGVSVTEAKRDSAAYGRRLKARRARLIARTESVRFTSAIVEETARQAGPGMVKQWVSSRDLDVEATCDALDDGKTKVPIGTDFPGGYSRPPAHPGCRCVLEIYKEAPTKPKPKPKKKPKPKPKPAAIVPRRPKKKPSDRTGDDRLAEDVATELAEIERTTGKALAVVQAEIDEVLDEIQKANTAWLEAMSVRRRKLGFVDYDHPTVVRTEAKLSVAQKKLPKPRARKADLLEERTALNVKVLERAEADRAAWRTTWAKSGKSAPAISTGDDVFRRFVHRRQVEDWDQKGAGWIEGVHVKRGTAATRASFTRIGQRGKKYGGWGPMLKIGAYDGPGVVVHELGHALEYLNRRILKSSQEFLKRRAGGDPLRKLADLFPDKGYRRGELARPDGFRDAYVGKHYDSATEVVSMGLEYMLKDPLAFYREDPDHFRYIWDIMRGVIP